MNQSKKQRNLWLAGILAFAFSSLTHAGEPPKIIASIKPIQLIVEAVTDGVTPVDTLLKPGASPHNHSLKPSDARMLDEADIVFWVGPDLEVFLEKMLSGSRNALSVPLMTEATLELRKHDAKDEHGHNHDREHDHKSEHDHDNGHDHDAEHDHGSEHQHHHGEYDAHIWLSPNNAISMAKTVAEKLIAIDPENQQKYLENLKSFQQSLMAADKENIKKLADIHSKPMFVFHDAYGYLEHHYELNIVNHFTINPEMKPGAKHLIAIQNQLKASGQSCVFTEPQFTPHYLDRMLEGTDANVKVLDPLAENVSGGSRGYIDFLNGTVDSIVHCFK